MAAPTSLAARSDDPLHPRGRPHRATAGVIARQNVRSAVPLGADCLEIRSGPSPGDTCSLVNPRGLGHGALEGVQPEVGAARHLEDRLLAPGRTARPPSAPRARPRAGSPRRRGGRRGSDRPSAPPCRTRRPCRQRRSRAPRRATASPCRTAPGTRGATASRSRTPPSVTRPRQPSALWIAVCTSPQKQPKPMRIDVLDDHDLRPAAVRDVAVVLEPRLALLRRREAGRQRRADQAVRA